MNNPRHHLVEEKLPNYNGKQPSALFKELCEQFAYYCNGLLVMQAKDENADWYFDKTTSVIKLTKELGLLEDLCEAFPKQASFIVGDILDTTDWKSK